MGEGLVRALPAMGARVVSLDLNADAGARVAGEAGATFLGVDVTDKASVDAATNQAVAALDGLDVLIHAAGIAPGAPAESIPPEQWLEAIAVNATGTFLVNQAVFPHLTDRGGAIINFASSAGSNQGLSGQGSLCRRQGRGGCLGALNRQRMGPLQYPRQRHRAHHLDTDVRQDPRQHERRPAGCP